MLQACHFASKRRLSTIRAFLQNSSRLVGGTDMAQDQATRAGPSSPAYLPGPILALLATARWYSLREEAPLQRAFLLNLRT